MDNIDPVIRQVNFWRYQDVVFLEGIHKNFYERSELNDAVIRKGVSEDNKKALHFEVRI